jgi:hypothetical protein
VVKNPSKAEVLKGHGFSRAARTIEQTLGFTGCGKTHLWQVLYQGMTLVVPIKPIK